MGLAILTLIFSSPTLLFLCIALTFFQPSQRKFLVFFSFIWENTPFAQYTRLSQRLFLNQKDKNILKQRQMLSPIPADFETF